MMFKLLFHHNHSSYHVFIDNLIGHVSIILIMFLLFFLLELILKPLLFSQVLLLYRNEISNKGDTFNES